MSKTPFTAEYWENRYQTGQTGWDAGAITTPLRAYFDQLENKALRILIPGGGNSHEAGYLFEQGFTEVYVVDLAQTPLRNFQERYPAFPADHLIQDDFFHLTGPYDRIVEQTFFCALDPALRRAYAEKMHALLAPGGHLVGVLFDDPLFQDHPPFGGNREEYLTYFADLFEIRTLDRAYNSIPPRAGRELFINLIKR
ncbi:Thiopurine S-methyltransferase (TPMT) [Catalinimonas alkaloidigena]|uniref:Thiopurine S-methyltransferase (TPMT) n=1 Tax=Catalinimonas alkaloidigena TaxID=1075417 RepID=A0A1G9BKV9_9BACT|nr:SAM-dependent methyltransferase [Catalinimonas alkaloidigena]SDK39880.1 Thiopurine S-methyltransferase (TPMT) [Catalinimonas alkaloidigena]